MKKIFAVESISTFAEVHLVEAETADEAEFIAKNSDYNASKWLGQQISTVVEYNERDKERFGQIDSYFFDGYAYVDETGHLGYKKMSGEENGNMPKTKII
jgi:hypothetical protein